MSEVVPDKRPHNREKMRIALRDAQHGWHADLRASIAVLPDPREYAYRMSATVAEALLCVEMRHSTLCLPRELATRLRPYGLVDYATSNLTAFGAAVYRELREMDA